MSNNIINISIIIPIYNVQEYLEQCIKLILKSIESNYELILVNDGSTDDSFNICKKYSSRNNNIKIVNKKNGGLSSARNAGIDVAQGKYIVFLDPDDEINENYFKNLLNIMEKNKCDIVISGYETFPVKKVITPGYKLNTILEGRDLVLSAKNIHSNNELCFVWRNIYKLDIIKRNNIRFNEEVFIGEDVIFNLEFLLKSKRAYAVDEVLYYYRTNNANSLMRAKYKPNLEKSLLKQYEVRKYLSEEYNLLSDKNYKFDMANYYLKSIYFMMINNLKNAEQKNIKEKIYEIINFNMIRDSIKTLGFSYKCNNMKEYVYYLLLKYRIKFLILRIYEKG